MLNKQIKIFDYIKYLNKKKTDKTILCFYSSIYYNNDNFLL